MSYDSNPNRCPKCGSWDIEKRQLFRTYYVHCRICDAPPPPEKVNDNEWTNHMSILHGDGRHELIPISDYKLFMDGLEKAFADDDESGKV